jgi:hypothetical protein
MGRDVEGAQLVAPDHLNLPIREPLQAVDVVEEGTSSAHGRKLTAAAAAHEAPSLRTCGHDTPPPPPVDAVDG